MNAPRKRKVIDAHLHLYDHHANRHEFLETPDPIFVALVGDYSTLPRRYLLDDYLRDEPAIDVEAIIWHEFLSRDSLREVQWAQQLANHSKVPVAIVGLADFLAHDLQARLEAYAQCPNVVCVRQHLGWDETNPLNGAVAVEPG